MNANSTDSLRWLVSALIGGSVFVIGFLAARAPIASDQRLGLRGLKRDRTLQTNQTWSWFEPIVRWLGLRLSAGMPQRWREELDRRIVLAGDFMGVLPEELVALSVLTTSCGLAVGAALSRMTTLGSIAPIAGATVGAAIPYFSIMNAASQRAKAVNRRLPHAIDSLALCMGAGLDFPGAVRQAVEKSGSKEDPVVEEFSLILQTLQLGRTRQQALNGFAQRVPIEAVVEFVGSVVQAELYGNPVADVLRIQAEILRRKRSVRAEELAARAGVAMMGPLLLVFIAVMILIVGPVVMRLQSASF